MPFLGKFSELNSDPLMVVLYRRYSGHHDLRVNVCSQSADLVGLSPEIDDRDRLSSNFDDARRQCVEKNRVLFGERHTVADQVEEVRPEHLHFGRLLGTFFASTGPDLGPQRFVVLC